jgi:hypothetical protein
MAELGAMFAAMLGKESIGRSSLLLLGMEANWDQWCVGALQQQVLLGVSSPAVSAA